MAETINLKKRLIGKEDINFDISGIGETETFITPSGSSKSVTKINATHIPLTKSTRNKLNAANVEDALEKVSDKLDDFKTIDVTTQDVVVDFLAEDDAESIQFKINDQKKNLNGHTITFNFPSSLAQNLFSAIEWNSFYNGMLVINGGEDSSSKISVYDRVDLGAVFKIKNCLCNVVIQNFYIIHQSSKYGISVDGSSAVIIKNCSFSGIVNAESYAVYKSASNVVLSEVTVNNDNTIYTNGDVFSVDGVIADKSGNIPLNAFPKSGGLLTGSLIGRNVDDSYLTLFAGTNTNRGAKLALYGIDSPVNPGCFAVEAKDGKDLSTFIVKPNGELMFKGQNIVRSVNNVTADAAGNVNLTAGNVGALPNTGGTLSGSLRLSGDASIGHSDNNLYTYVYGASDGNHGAFLLLTGQGYSTSGVYFRIAARQDGAGPDLIGNNSGELTWNSKHIVRSVDGVNAGGDGNVALNALPKSGGQMTGSNISRDTNSGALVLYGGLAGEINGAYLALYGREHSSNKGVFYLRAHNGEATCVLSGTPDGSLTWGGKNIVRSVGGKTADAAGNVPLHGVVETWKSSDGLSWYRKWSDGWIEQGGVTDAASTSSKSLTFNTPFTNIPNVQLTGVKSINGTSTGSIGDGSGCMAVNNVTKTNFGYISTSGQNIKCFWYACGF
jgi:hypothetical protein